MERLLVQGHLCERRSLHTGQSSQLRERGLHISVMVRASVHVPPREANRGVAGIPAGLAAAATIEKRLVIIL